MNHYFVTTKGDGIAENFATFLTRNVLFEAGMLLKMMIVEIPLVFEGLKANRTFIRVRLKACFGFMMHILWCSRLYLYY